VYAFLPPRQAFTWRSWEGYGPIVLMLLLFFGFRVLAAIVFSPAVAIARLLLGG
jgi:hypothetical protein